ncbi:MAG: hypothetical protein HN348_04695 [Proteobacteria bacterium]|nr:hypothetical protein [Pseudomonadota bacterium]
MAPVNRALNLGRVPRLTARIIRRLDDKKLLGQHLLLVGTNALFCYESAAGVLLDSGLLATGDADLLWDARQRVALLLPEVRRSGIIDILRRTDRSFETRGPEDFRAINSKGFYIDLIRPEDRNFFNLESRSTLGGGADDLRGAPIFGLRWLINAPRFEAIVIGEGGYPLRLVTPDPRAFALHKLWISESPQRDPVKRKRDKLQAQITAQLCRTYFNLDFSTKDLRSLPEFLRKLANNLEATEHSTASDDGAVPIPDW